MPSCSGWNPHRSFPKHSREDINNILMYIRDYPHIGPNPDILDVLMVHGTHLKAQQEHQKRMQEQKAQRRTYAGRR